MLDEQKKQQWMQNFKLNFETGHLPEPGKVSANTLSEKSYIDYFIVRRPTKLLWTQAILSEFILDRETFE